MSGMGFRLRAILSHLLVRIFHCTNNEQFWVEYLRHFFKNKCKVVSLNQPCFLTPLLLAASDHRSFVRSLSFARFCIFDFFDSTRFVFVAAAALCSLSLSLLSALSLSPSLSLSLSIYLSLSLSLYLSISISLSLSEAELRVLLDEQCLVIVDEAYAEFASWTAVPLLARYPNLVVMRTFRHAARGGGITSLRDGGQSLHTHQYISNAFPPTRTLQTFFSSLCMSTFSHGIRNKCGETMSQSPSYF